jgi:hypothetical protein
MVAIHVNETSWAHVWRLRFRYLGTGYDRMSPRLRQDLQSHWQINLQWYGDSLARGL